MRVLITGASGLLGLNLALDALRTHTVIGVDRGTLVSPPFRLIQTDLLESGAIERALTESQPEAVIHCAAIANVDVCERDPALARQVNTELATQVATACSRRGLNLVHISTDAVFDGTASVPYTEVDEPHPIGIYAETKRAAEAAVLAACPQAIVARVNFYGWSANGSRSLAEFFVNNLGAGKPVRGFTDVTFCPLFVSHLGRILLRMLDARLEGLYHVVGSEAMSKYDFGVQLARKFGFDAGLIATDSVESSGLAARRAHNLNLSVNKLSAALGERIPSFSTGLDEFYAQYLQGYPQKIRGYQLAPSVDSPAPRGG